MHSAKIRDGGVDVSTGSVDLIEQCRAVRLTILDTAFRAGKGHIGSALSVSDSVTTVLNFVRGLGSNSPNRDRFVLSKGHAATALYANLAARGLLEPDELESYGRNDTRLGTHPTADIPGVDFATGSLGQGITFAVGAALAGRLAIDDRKVFCVLSDSELDEGATWEAAMFAGHQVLDNLIVILDFNGQQALGRTQDISNLDGVPDAWAALGWHISVVDGHAPEKIHEAIQLALRSSKPSLLVAKTIAGSGVPFMEEKVEWHYWPMTAAQYESAVESTKDWQTR